jgi:hypothetical protein
MANAILVISLSIAVQKLHGWCFSDANSQASRDGRGAVGFHSCVGYRSELPLIRPAASAEDRDLGQLLAELPILAPQLVWIPLVELGRFVVSAWLRVDEFARRPRMRVSKPVPPHTPAR